MKITANKVNYGSLYKLYEKEFYEAVKNAKQKGLLLIDENKDKLNFNDFKNFYKSHEVALKDKGKSLSSYNIVRDMVDMQRFSVTEKQGKAIQRSLRARGKELDLATIRTYAGYLNELEDLAVEKLPFHMNKKIQIIKDFFDEVKFRYRGLRKEGLTAAGAKIIIAQEFFGS